MIRILALDPSLTRTGYALADGNHGVLASPYGPDAAMMRLFWIRERIAGLCSAQRPDIVCIEGYSFASEHSRAHAAGELGGVIRLYLFEAGIRYVEVPPASLKMYATGSGNANKEAMLTAAVRELGYKGHDNNESDALWLREMALARYDPQPAPAEAFRLEAQTKRGAKPLAAQRARALEGVTWPGVCTTGDAGGSTNMMTGNART